MPASCNRALVFVVAKAIQSTEPVPWKLGSADPEASRSLVEMFLGDLSSVMGFFLG